MPLPAEEMCYTFADMLDWEEQERIELIDGEARLMATPLRIHQRISGELFRQIANYLTDKPCEVYAAPFAVRLFEKAGDRPEDVDTVLEPDLTVVCDAGKLDKYGCRGAPDLVIEVLSPSTRRLDLTVKYRLYQSAGVRAYWIVDPDRKIVQVFRPDENGLYNAGDVFTSEAAVPVDFWEDFSVNLARVFAE